MCPASEEIDVIAWQLGRPPRGAFTVVKRCSFGYPMVLETSPLVGGKPFPTLHWLTCPHLRKEISRLEAEGHIKRYQEILKVSPVFRQLFLEAVEADRKRKKELSKTLQGETAWIEKLGIGGVRNPLNVKCLHLHVASYLAGIPNPIGEDILKSIKPECSNKICSRYRSDEDETD